MIRGGIPSAARSRAHLFRLAGLIRPHLRASVQFTNPQPESGYGLSKVTVIRNPHPRYIPFIRLAQRLEFFPFGRP
jgi:hypothetical protein